jgi:ribosomal-protein-alanine N-acetyltransferase
VIAYGGVWLVVDEAHITTVAVDEAKRRNGVGKRMMVELLNRSQEAGMKCSTLEVRAGNDPAVKLYEKLGYVTTARRKGYYPDNNEDALVMWLHDLVNWEPPRA